jgi:hypothetical protein
VHAAINAMCSKQHWLVCVLFDWIRLDSHFKRQFSFIKNTSDFKTFCEAFVVEFYLKLRLILRMITYLTYICWEIDNFVIKSDIFRRFFICKNILKKLSVTMTTTLDTSCSENTMVLSARRGFLHACIF